MPSSVSSSRPVRRRLPVLITGLAVAVAPVLTIRSATALDAPQEAAAPAVAFEIQSLDGSGNNQANPTWGKSGLPYSRVAPTRYADGRSEPVAGPNARAVSNRVFHDDGTRTSSPSAGHPVGLRLGPVPRPHVRPARGPRARRSQGETRNIAFQPATTRWRSSPTTSAADPVRPLDRRGRHRRHQPTAADQHRQLVHRRVRRVRRHRHQRLEWLRDGPVDGNLANNGATPAAARRLPAARDAGATPATAPAMDIDGRLRAYAEPAPVAGDVRANENIAPDGDPDAVRPRAQPDRRACCPTRSAARRSSRSPGGSSSPSSSTSPTTSSCPPMGVTLPAYTGYNPNVNATLSNEFATVGYRAHSMIHGEFEFEAEAARYTAAQLDGVRGPGHRGRRSTATRSRSPSR